MTIMGLVFLILILALIGLLAHVVTTQVPMHLYVKTIILIVAIIGMLVITLQQFGYPLR